MGRPIKKKFFGNLISPGGAAGVGGEGIASVAVTGSPTGKNTGTYAATIAAPAIAGGTQAAGTVTVAADRSTVTFTLTTAGSGYLTAPTITSTAANAGGSGTATFTATLTADRQNAIAFGSYLTTGSNQVTNGDILKQEASRRYLVRNSEGVGQCKLVTTSTLTVGTMNIVATDWNGSTYYVKKLTARKAVLVQSTVSTAFLVGNGVSTGWTLNAATGTVVTISDTI
jgi:hypothetical protein